MTIPPIRFTVNWHTPGGHLYRLVYSPGQELMACGMMGVWACDPQLDFTWNDFEGMQKIMRRLSGQASVGTHEAPT